MTKQHILMTIFCAMCLIGVRSTLYAQAPENYVITMWTFDTSQRYDDERPDEADYNVQSEPAILTMLGGDIERRGGSGTVYRDFCGTRYDSTEAIRWDDVRGEDENIVEDDAQLRLVTSTTDWEDLAFRFYYRSENTRSFDLSYHLGDGNWKLVADDVIIDASDDWNNIEVGLQEEDDLDNRDIVVFLVHDLTRDNGREKLLLDNIAIVGQRTSRPSNCPPVLQALNPIEQIDISLTTGDLPTFTNENGFQFMVTDDQSSFNEMKIVALTNNPNVINDLQLTPIDSSTGIFQLDIGAPHGYAGIADVMLRIFDSSGNMTEHIITYNVSESPTS